ncbi:MAG TPA: RNA methyltransferase [Acidimicrobiales bacterium]|nr:RNA methyltransferase [Acidimicrobiales bacterium]
MQRLRRLSGRANARRAEGLVVAEGAKVLGEALRSGRPVEAVYLDPGAGPPELELAGRCHDAGARVFELEPGVIGRVTATVTPQPIVGVVAAPGTTLDAVIGAGPDLVVVCAGVRDPGNAGTVLRSADAAGASAVVSCGGSVDLFNPKTVRASAGAVFHVPVVEEGEPSSVLDRLGRAGLRRVGATAHDGADYLEADLSAPLALVVGNEAHGLSPEVAARLDGTVTIPMAGRAESLNVGIATAVLCFEVARRRRPPAAPHP